MLKERGYELRDTVSSTAMRLHFSLRTFFFRTFSSSSRSEILISMPPDHGLSDKQQSGVKGKKLRLTVLFVANADGMKKLPPLIIRRAHKPCAFQGKTGEQLGFNY